MRNVYISLPTVDIVQRFVAQVSVLEGDFDLVSGEYIIDARSLMGIFSLDRSKPIRLAVQKDTEKNMKALAPYQV